MYPLLSRITVPADFRDFSPEQLETLCNELRSFIIDEVSRHGGHFSANLGVVELTVALHYVLNTPQDQLIWDVGHQAYAHKILTGRRDRFSTNRKRGGLSGFPKRSESEYDAFGTGHSSTAISAALGMAISASLRGDHLRQHVAVIGDGALTAGLAFEGLNHAGSLNTNLLVVLNDNSISIDPNVGALKDYLAGLSLRGKRDSFREEVLEILRDARNSGLDEELLQKFESSAHTLLGKDVNFFESLNFRYFGPVDGHDVNELTRVLEKLRKLPGPKLLHVLTLKGKGFGPAEKEQTKWHATGVFDKLSGAPEKSQGGPRPPKYQDVFGHTLLELAQINEKVVGITPAMPSGCSMNIMMEVLPERVFDVGIAEQHAVTLAAGMAADGLVPFCNLYSTFAQRAYDQIIHDVAVQKLPVIFCLDRAGLAGADGPTHHGAFDIAFLRCLPDMIIAAPLNEEELRHMMYSAMLDRNGPYSIRYPRGEGVMLDWRLPMQSLEKGKGRILRQGNKVAVLSLGHIGNEAATALDQLEKEGLSLTHADLRFAKPLDETLILQLAHSHDILVSVEDGCLSGGVGSAIAELLLDHRIARRFIRLGIPDDFIEQGSQKELYQLCGIDSESIYQTLRKELK